MKDANANVPLFAAIDLANAYHDLGDMVRNNRWPSGNRRPHDIINAYLKASKIVGYDLVNERYMAMANEVAEELEQRHSESVARIFNRKVSA